MAAKRKRRKGGKASAGFNLVVLLIGFLLGVYIHATSPGVIPEEISELFGIKASERVTPERKPPVKQPDRKDLQDDSLNFYSLQLAAFKNIESALGLVDTLSTRGYSAFIQTRSTSAGSFYAVRSGLWTSKLEAERAARDFKSEEEMRAEVVQIK